VAIGVLMAATAQAETVTVTAMGTVVFNLITEPPLSGVAAGEQVSMTFDVDSDNYVEGIPGDTRGYEIMQPSFTLSFSGGVSMGLADPFPPAETPYFTLVEGFPVSDGFFVANSAVSPGGVPLAQDPMSFNLDLGYEGATLATLDILDALGVYDYTGLTRFGFNLWRNFPGNVGMEMDYEQMTIATAVPVEPSTWGAVKELFQ
jgi:hypothetical protein